MRHVIVVGAGISGIAAAIFAAKAGARVSILEKTADLAGMLWHSSANFSAAGTRLQASKGIEDSPADHYEDIWRMGHGRSDPALLRLAVDHAAEGVDWLTEIGVPWTANSPVMVFSHETYRRARTFFPQGYPGLAGNGLGKRVAEVIIAEFNRWLDQGVSIQYRAQVIDLLTEDSDVIGVRHEQHGETHDLVGDAVILASGGYGASADLIRRYHPRHEGIAIMCLPHATGDGLALVERIGGTLTNMDVVLLFPGAVRDPRAPRNAIFEILPISIRPPRIAGDIWVNSRGERFIREDEPSPERREHAIMAQPNASLICIFDEPMRRGLDPAVTRRMAEIENVVPPLVVTGQTIAELASKLGLPPETLRATVDRYNQAVATGVDAECGREAMPKAIDTPPYHAIPTSGTILLTHGGVKVNDHLQPVRVDGTPIAGLYAIGEVIGGAQVMGATFASGQGAGAGLTFGILAGRWAAAS